MPIALRQLAGNTVDAGTNRSCTVALPNTSQPNSLLWLVGVATHNRENTGALTKDPPGFSRVFVRREDKLTVGVWRREAAPATSKVTVESSGVTFTLQAELLEWTGVAQANALDKVAIRGANPQTGPGSSAATSGATGTLSQGDELLLGIVVNRYASTRQSGFTGGLAKLVEQESDASEPDHDRTRLTVHAQVTTTNTGASLGAQLSANRDWVAAVVSFRGGSLGPMRMTSKLQPPIIRITGRGRLTLFGPLRSKKQPPLITVTGRGWIGPFEQQYLLGGRGGLLIGRGTPYRVTSMEGLGGHEVRQSDTDHPDGDGAQRGVDLQQPRQVLGRVNFDGPPAEMEAAMQRLLAVLRPRREDDWELIFRLAGMPLQVLRCRPLAVNREMNQQKLIVADQPFVLRAADPRIYSARRRRVVVPVTPAGSDSVVTLVSAVNAGTAEAYPRIRIRGAPGVDVTSVQLINATVDSRFEVAALLAPTAELVGDMDADVTGSPRSVVTIDGQPRYGAWVYPREPLVLAADPAAPGGVNALYLRTVPAGAPVTCELEYADTWHG